MQFGNRPCRSGIHLSQRLVRPRKGTIATRRGEPQQRLPRPARIAVGAQAYLDGIEWPIMQAPMAGVQGSGLAIAVTNAGGGLPALCAA